MKRKNIDKPAEVQQINIADIDRNPHNPRRLFDDDPMQILKQSIANRGVLVPVTVYERSSYDEKFGLKTGLKKYVLLDGERRWTCVTNLDKKKIPAIVVSEPNEVENIVTMFHIHNLREGWQLMPTALKLEVLITKLKTDNERELATITQLNVSQIRRCKILLSYNAKYRNMMLASPDARLKPDFFIELDRIRRAALHDKLNAWVKRGDEACIDILLTKYRSHVIKAVTDFRDLAAIYKSANENGKMQIFSKQLDKFFDNPKMAITDIDIQGIDYRKETFELRRTSNRLLNQLESVNDEALAANKELVESLYKLAKKISERLGRTLVIESKNELS